MNRIIRFRGRRADGKWLHGDLIHNRGRVYIADDSIVDGNDIRGHTDFEVGPDTIGQYIGRDDSLGVRIYTGDKVCFFFEGKAVEGIIEYSEKWVGYCTRIFIDGALSQLYTAVPHHCTIIGNIYDIPKTPNLPLYHNRF